MPAGVRKQGDKFRVINKDTNRIEKNRAGTAVDGGGHQRRSQAQQQARAINSRGRNG